MGTQNYVSIMKRKDMENHLMNRQKTFYFQPKMIGGRIGTLLDVGAAK